jgi:hypothetical protein
MEMSTQFVIAVVVLAFLAFGMFMHSRAKAKIRPVFDAAAKKYQGTVRQSILAMPQLVVERRGIALRITAMSRSLDTPQGGGDITCIDFDVGKRIGNFRVQEQSDFNRTAVPKAFMGESQPFTTGIREFDARFASCASNATQAKRVLKDPSLLEAILALPHGADIRVRDGKGYVSVDSHPDDIAFVDRMMSTAEHLMESLANNA